MIDLFRRALTEKGLKHFMPVEKCGQPFTCLFRRALTEKGLEQGPRTTRRWRPTQTLIRIGERVTLPAQRARTIKPGAERWRRPRRRRAALGKRKNNSEAPIGALQNEARVRSHVSAVSTMKISQERNIVRNARRVDPVTPRLGLGWLWGPST